MSMINKRQQARHERALQDLIRNVPGNDKCADCSTNNPGWASWNLGIFLCVRCASLHRKLGTHISKVKSLSMDSWTSEQIDNMKRTGNTISNRQYNPKNVRPAIPIDIDEVDGVMERFIRQKYDQKTLSNDPPSSSTQYTGSTSSDDRPQLPPKPSKRFTFLRSTSSTVPASQKSPVSPVNGSFGFGRKSSPEKKTKPAKIFGVDIGSSRVDNYELKLIQLREMGFPDDRRNLAILKGENGNIDRSVATLIRLGEGSRHDEEDDDDDDFDVPETPPKDEDYVPAEGNKDKALPAPPVEDSTPVIAANNPFFQLQQQQQQPAQPFGPSHQQLPVQQSLETYQSTPGQQQPLGQSFVPAQQSLEQSFQHLQVSQPTQIFPNTTGGPVQQPFGNNPFMQSYTPPPQATQGSYMYSQPQVGSFQPINNNPFMRPTPSPSPPAANPFMQSFNSIQPIQNNQFNQIQTQPTGYNPFGMQMQQQQQQPQQQFQSQQSLIGNPFHHAATFPITASPQQHAANQFGATQFAQQPQKYDKASILALYNLTPPQTTVSPVTNQANLQIPSQTAQQQPQQPMQPQSNSPFFKRVNTAPVTSSNPFGVPSPPADIPTALPHSQTFHSMKSGQSFGPKPGHESIDFSTASSYLNGRHSPDMFAGLSARVMR